MTKLEALPIIAPAAVRSERATGFPAIVTTAQCGLETGWLKRAPKNNCFGIKAAARHTATQTLLTTEFDGGKPIKIPQEFAAYDSLEDCFRDHGKLLTTRPIYAIAWEQYKKDGDIERLVYGIASRYATDPAYASKVLRIMRDPDVSAAIQAAREDAK